MSWFQTGHKATGEEGAKSPFDSKGPQRLWMPPETKTLLMFLDDDPTGYWNHGFKLNGKWTGNEPCHKKNLGLAESSGGECAVCASGDKMFPAYTNHYTMINMTPWITDKGREINFRRQIFACKMGSKEKPGIAKKVGRLFETHGRLKGLIFEVYRSGKKTESCGDDFTLVEKVSPEDIRAFGMEKLAAYAKRVNEKVTAEKDKITVENLWKFNPWEPWNFEKLMDKGGPLAPRSAGELRRLFTSGAASGGNDDDFGGDDGGGGGGSSKENDKADDDVPY